MVGPSHDSTSEPQAGKGPRAFASRASLRAMAPINWLRAKSGQLFQLKDLPHVIAIGLATGVFFGFTPLWGLKTLLALGVTRLLRGNVLAAALAVTLHDVLLPIMPLVMRWEYDLGYWLLSHPHEFPGRFQLDGIHPAIWLHWSTFFPVGRPLLAGSVAFAAPLALATYYLARWWLIRRPKAGGSDAAA